MRSVGDWLHEYGLSHRHPVNKLLHFVCVPPIVLAVLGLLWCLPRPAALAALPPWVNFASLAAAAAKETRVRVEGFSKMQAMVSP